MAFRKGRKAKRAKKKETAKGFRMRLRERRDAFGPQLSREMDRRPWGDA